MGTAVCRSMSASLSVVEYKPAQDIECGSSFRKTSYILCARATLEKSTQITKAHCNEHREHIAFAQTRMKAEPVEIECGFSYNW